MLAVAGAGPVADVGVEMLVVVLMTAVVVAPYDEHANAARPTTTTQRDECLWITFMVSLLISIAPEGSFRLIDNLYCGRGINESAAGSYHRLDACRVG